MKRKKHWNPDRGRLARSEAQLRRLTLDAGEIAVSEGWLSRQDWEGRRDQMDMQNVISRRLEKIS